MFAHYNAAKVVNLVEVEEDRTALALVLLDGRRVSARLTLPKPGIVAHLHDVSLSGPVRLTLDDMRLVASAVLTSWARRRRAR